MTTLDAVNYFAVPDPLDRRRDVLWLRVQRGAAAGQLRELGPRYRTTNRGGGHPSSPQERGRQGVARRALGARARCPDLDDRRGRGGPDQSGVAVRLDVEPMCALRPSAR